MNQLRDEETECNRYTTEKIQADAKKSDSQMNFEKISEKYQKLVTNHQELVHELNEEKLSKQNYEDEIIGKQREIEKMNKRKTDLITENNTLQNNIN